MKLKKVIAVSAAVAVALSSVMGVSAASLKDLFDAEYYASAYSDVKEVFGEDEYALFHHFEEYGMNEQRKASLYFDIVAYRERYPDLEEAFGDNWAAYYEHFLTFGAEEGRNPFTDGFDFREYADRYPDLKEAFGYDMIALYKHFITMGKHEGRNPAAPTPVPEKSGNDETEKTPGSGEEDVEKPDDTVSGGDAVDDGTDVPGGTVSGGDPEDGGDEMPGGTVSGGDPEDGGDEMPDGTVSGGDPTGGGNSGDDSDSVENDGFVRPADGGVIIPFSMSHTVYFYTLRQYRCSPYTVIAASENASVKAYERGKVVEVGEDEQVGKYVVMDLGDGYQVRYGQLKDISVTVDEYVERGEAFAVIAKPTIIFTVEGANLNLMLTLNGEAVDPKVLYE